MKLIDPNQSVVTPDLVDRTLIPYAVNGLGHNRQDTAIVEAVVKLAHALGLTVTAEGVENRRQEAVLRKLGCDALQGHLYSPALPAADLARLLQAWHAAA